MQAVIAAGTANFFTSENLKELDEMKRLMVQIGGNVNDIVNKRD